MIQNHLAAVGAWMNRAGIPGEGFQSVRPIGGGTQNIMLMLQRGGEYYVLRRGPQHLRSNSNSVLRREVRLLQALSATEVDCPRLLASCDDEAVFGGSVFYLMAPIDGFNPATEMPEAYMSPAAHRDMVLSTVDALAALHNVDHRAIALDDVKRPDDFLKRQVPRWLAELDGYARYPNYPGSHLPGVADTGRWLEAHMPRAWKPGILHGDFNLANVMYFHALPKVAAIVDWEMWTIGDPLLDLAWLLVTLPRPDAPVKISFKGRTEWLPAEAELLDRYSRQTDRNMESMLWYKTLACFKLGIILEGTFARSCAGEATGEMGAFMHESAVNLLRMAQDLARSAQSETPPAHS